MIKFCTRPAGFAAGKMKLSLYGEKTAKGSGILSLMQDLDAALGNPVKGDLYFLGGGNPAEIPELTAIFREAMESVLDSPSDFSSMIGVYDAPAGNTLFRELMAEYFSNYFNTYITRENIAITSGSQNTFFILFNLFAGMASDGKILKAGFPMLPEYIGYGDTGFSPDLFTGCPGLSETTGDSSYRYRPDYPCIESLENLGILALSRPGNPTGGVLPTEDLERLLYFAQKKDIPLLIDNAYGAPFPAILFKDTEPLPWHNHALYSFSLSKLGLPGLRTGILVGNSEVISLIEKFNAVSQLSVNGAGPAIGSYLLKNNLLAKISDDILKPYYAQKSRLTIETLQKHNKDHLFRYHESDGAFFLWVTVPSLSVPTVQAYKILRNRGVITVPGIHYYPGCKSSKGKDKSFRLSFTRDNETIEKGIAIFADEIRKTVIERPEP